MLCVCGFKIKVLLQVELHNFKWYEVDQEIMKECSNSMLIEIYWWKMVVFLYKNVYVTFFIQNENFPFCVKKYDPETILR